MSPMGISIGIGIGIGQGKGGGVPAAPLRLATLNASVHNINRGVTASNSNKRLTRTPDRIGKHDMSELRLVVGGYFVAQASAEANLGNDYLVSAVLEFPGGSTPYKRLTWGGLPTGTVPDGAAEYVSDPLYPADFGLSTFPALTDMWWRIERQCSVGQFLPFAQGVSNPTIPGLRTIQMADTSPSQLEATGVLNTGGATGATNLNTFPMPLAVIGRAADGQDYVAVIGEGDSITEGRNAGIGNGQNGSGGYFIQGMYSAGIPFTNLAVGGTLIMQQGGGVQKRETLYKYATHLWLGFPRNDIAGGRTAAQILADFTTKTTRSRAAGIQHIEALMPVPSTTSTDLWASAANQTAIANFGVGGVRDQIIAAFASPSTYGIDAILDMRTQFQDPVVTTAWISDGVASKFTDDGVHPTGTLHNAMASVFATRANTWTL